MSSLGMLKKLSYKLRENIYNNGLPNKHFSEDIFLVSFPKSGNHWLRFLVANAIRFHFHIDKQVNFFTIDEIIPDIHSPCKTYREKGMYGRDDLPRIFKSHHSYNPYYNRVILLLRDPRDVIVSYYHFLLDRKLISSLWTISDFIRDPNYGARAWEKHTKSWYLNFRPGQIIRPFLYENIMNDTPLHLSMIMDLFGYKLSDSAIENTISHCSKEHMMISQDIHRSVLLTNEIKAPLVRNSFLDNKRGLSECDREYIECITKNIASRVGYYL